MKVTWEMGGVMAIEPETQMEVFALQHWVKINVTKKGMVKPGAVAFTFPGELIDLRKQDREAA
jgi:hypothetical protein